MVKATEYYYVPLDQSLTSDAPGYGDAPVCWKCRGAAAVNNKCKVCQGTGRLPKRKIRDRPGKITRGRRHLQEQTTTSMATTLPPPTGYAVPFYGPLVKACTEHCHDHIVEGSDESQPPPPVWWPCHPNEELCNLTGNGWRILQRVKDHRWTTDDLVSAAVAVRWCQQKKPVRRYLDLGCGNASVLQMVLSCVSRETIQTAIGVEARTEAVSLARRSLAFNLGPQQQERAHIVHADFRGFATDQEQEPFHMITGTPPYFAVGTHGGSNQGGMPSALQSAPARCEFRGGFEAYCETAARVADADDCVFCVCINYLNHDRALLALDCHGWRVREIHMVRGKVNAPDPLFVVYASTRSKTDEMSDMTAVKQRELVVRDEQGEWTREYKEDILQFMSIL